MNAKEKILTRLRKRHIEGTSLLHIQTNNIMISRDLYNRVADKKSHEITSESVKDVEDHAYR